MRGQRISQIEFAALMAMLISTTALAVDAMLPALPQMAQELSPQDTNRVQLVVTSFLLGMGVGTFFAGPLSDRFGRKPVIIAGLAIYIAGAVITGMADSLEMVLIGRVIQGLGAAGPRVVTLAVVRDLVSGREMARLTSFIMIIFTLVPAFAPSIGATILLWAEWRAIFFLFMGFGALSGLWLIIRLREPLAPQERRRLTLRQFGLGIRESFSHVSFRVSIVAQSMAFAMLFALLSSTQQIFDQHFDRAENFHLWFSLIAVVAGTSGLLNSALVMRLGMRFLVFTAFVAQIALSSIMLLLLNLPLSADTLFPFFVVWQISIFFQIGMTVGNLNAMAMEPLGHVAGLAASIVGALATLLSVAIAIPVGLAFDGTPVPLVQGVLALSIVASLSMLYLRKRELPPLVAT